MKRLLCLFAPVILSLSAPAEARRSSRNLEPLLRKPGASQAAARSGDTGLAVATPPKETAAQTVTRVTFLGPKRGWGFVQTSSPYYSPQGKCLGTLPGGTAFTYSAVKASSRNDLLVSAVKRGDAWEGPYLLDCTDVAAYEGNPDTVDPQTVADLGRYYSLLGKIADRKAELTEQALAANPHFESARQAQKAYQDSLVKATAMEAQMNTLTGSRKSKSLDALRAFKYEQVTIKAKADQEAAAYKAWKDAHPVDSAKLAADPQLQALEKERLETKAHISNLVN